MDGCLLGSVLAGHSRSVGICIQLNISVESMHSRALPVITIMSFLCSLSIKSPNEGNDVNREPPKRHAAHHFLDSLDVISELGQTIREQNHGSLSLALNFFPKMCLAISISSYIEGALINNHSNLANTFV